MLSTGEFYALYPGGGFVVWLGRNMANSEYVLNYLIENNWIDHLTRAIIIEFWTYNPNSNTFATIKILIECGASGLIRTHSVVMKFLFLF